MSRATGFDNDVYVREQTAAIVERMERSGDRLYLEFGGKLLYDSHAARVLPGMHPNVKMRLLHEFRDKADVLLCIHSAALEQKKIRADFGSTYDADAVRMIDDLRENGIEPAAVVLTRFDDQPAASAFQRLLAERGVNVVVHRNTPGYPSELDLLISEDGYGCNPFIESDHPLLIVTGPGPGSGKMATCLNQMYHERQRGARVGFAKFETFPIWDLPLDHPVNLAYEAATADIGMGNVIDPFHLELCGEKATSYQRDVEAFPVRRRILERLTDDDGSYRSPTEMAVNTASKAITDDEVVREAGRQEVLRRYFRYSSEYVMALAEKDAVERVRGIMQRLGLRPEDRRVVGPARQASQEAERSGKGSEGIFCGAALELPDGTVITGKNSPILHAASAVVLNALKELAGVPDEIHLLAPTLIKAVSALKVDVLGSPAVSLDLEETIVALGISAASNHAAQLCVDRFPELDGCDAHITHIPTPGDAAGFRHVGVQLTSDPTFSTKHLFVY